jgi:hypothetical protein
VRVRARARARVAAATSLPLVPPLTTYYLLLTTYYLLLTTYLAAAGGAARGVEHRSYSVDRQAGLRLELLRVRGRGRVGVRVGMRVGIKVRVSKPYASAASPGARRRWCGRWTSGRRRRYGQRAAAHSNYSRGEYSRGEQEP